MKKVAIFIDISNIFYSLTNNYNEAKLDYKKYLKTCVSENDRLIKAVGYGSRSYQNDDIVDSFIIKLQECGIETKYKAVRSYDDGKVKKGNCDIDMTIDIVRFVMGNPVDKVILGTADGDMAPLVEWLRDQRVEVGIVASKISRLLKQNCSYWKEIDDSMFYKEEKNGHNSQSSKE